MERELWMALYHLAKACDSREPWRLGKFFRF